MAWFLLAGAALLGVTVAGSVTCSASAPLSCHNTTAYDTCCLNSPGGSLLQTQFWDTSPTTGPANSWTIHGLWPDNCDGTYVSDCDPSRAYTNITQILQAAAPSTLQFMQTYWKNDPDDGSDEELWEHEWETHGTCISTLDPSCYTNYQPTEEAVDFFNRVVALFQTLPSYEWLAAAGIVPSTSATYTLSAIEDALKSQFGYEVVVNCNNDELDELYYYYNVQGSVQSGTFYPTTTVGSGSTCPSSKIKYLPKTGATSVTTPATSTTSKTKTTSTSTSTSTGKTTSTSTTTSTSSAPTSTPSGVVLSGKGYLNVITSGSQDGCIISYGTWYTTGTCATFTATPSGAGFTLTSSKGLCAVQNSALTCSSSVSTGTVFTYDGTYLNYDGSSSFYVTSVPTGSTQATVYTTSQAVTLEITWQAQ